MAKPKLALIPATQGSKLYSVLPADGVGDFNFSRNTGATRINKDGLIETVAVGKSRLNYPLIDGVVNGCPSHLLEPQRFQKIQYSEDFSNAYWTKSGLLTPTSGFVSPKGDLSAFKLVEDTSTGSHRILPNNTVNSQKHAFSVFVKKDTRNWIFLRLDGLASDQRTWFDLENGVIGTINSDHNAEIVSLSNGWYRCSVSIKGTTYQAAYPILGIADADNSSSYTGNGTSGVYIWGIQAEAGSYPTSYIPNYGTSAGITRSAETANGAGDASTFNDSEGVLMAEISTSSLNAYELISVTDSVSGNSFVSIGFNNSANNSYKQVRFGGINLFPNFIDPIIRTSFNKIAIKYKSGNSSFYVNGFEIDNSSITYTPSSVMSELKFSYYDNNDPFYGNTKQIQYFDSALNDSDLEKITSWTSFTDLANGQTYSIK